MVDDELKQRLMVSAILVPAFLFSLCVSSDIWTVACVGLAMLMMQEWERMSHSFSLALRASGICYIAVAVSAAILIRLGEEGVAAIMFSVFVVAMADSAAYFGGKRFGTRKLVPSISSGKTVEGFIIGTSAALLAGICYNLIFTVISMSSIFLCTLLIALISQAGDLLVSVMKRRADVKDSGTMLPGHGGLLDRLDSHMPALMLTYLFVN